MLAVTCNRKAQVINISTRDHLQTWSLPRHIICDQYVGCVSIDDYLTIQTVDSSLDLQESLDLLHRSLQLIPLNNFCGIAVTTIVCCQAPFLAPVNV